MFFFIFIFTFLFVKDQIYFVIIKDQIYVLKKKNQICFYIWKENMKRIFFMKMISFKKQIYAIWIKQTQQT